MRNLLTSILFVSCLFLLSCADKPVEDAFDKDFKPEKNNRIIYEYCIRCHVHKDLEAEYHITNQSLKYSDSKYSGATECSDCHDYSKDFWLGDEHRTTIYPK